MTSCSYKWVAVLAWIAIAAHVCPAADPDTNSPVIISVLPARDSVVTNLTQVLVVFNEPVFDVDPEDLLLNGIPALSVSNSGSSYYFAVPLPIPGLLRVGFNSNHGITDLVGNGFDQTLPGHNWTYTLVDIQAPTLNEVWPVPGATVTRLDTVEVLFSEPVTGIDAGDLLINGSPAAFLSGSGLGPYRFTFPTPSLGLVQLQWAPQTGIQDLADTPNSFVGDIWSYFLVSPANAGRVIINEFLANNVKNLTNEFGEAEDWIELFNPGSNAVPLLGWSLTDNKDSFGLWAFPDITLPPGAYLLLFADGRDLKSLSPSNYLHTNFKLNDRGEYLALCNADWPRAVVSAFDPQFPEQRPDYSYGLNAANGWSYFATPTPGKSNGSSSISGITPVPHANADGGLYAQPFTLFASCELPEATLRYTTDGSSPTALNGLPYTGPIGVSNTTVFRLAAFATNRLPSQVLTHSYIFIDQVLQQPKNPSAYPVGTNVWSGYPSDYEMDPEVVTNNRARLKSSLLSLPTLAISMKIDDLFGPNSGIYINPEQDPANRYLWERPCSAEFLLTNGQTGFHVDCGIRIQGNASRVPYKTPKHPFRLLFKSEYGPGTLNYPVFPDSTIRSFNDLVLRADYNNSWIHYDPNQRLHATKTRDAWTKETFRRMNGISGHSRPFHLYLNGLYWGLYDFGERIDAEFAASYLGGTATEYDAITSKPTEAIDGNMTAYTNMVSISRRSDMTQPSNYLLVQKYLDLPIFLDYMILNYYGANQDWGFDGNWNAVCRRTPGATFKYVVWDGEQLLNNSTDNRISDKDVPSGLHTNLVKSQEYRLDFADRVHRYCFNGGLLTPVPAAARWMQLARVVEPGMLAESARWGDYRRDVYSYSSGPYDLYTTNRHWWPEIERMRTNYFPARTDIFLAQLRTAGLYPKLAAPVFSQHGGQVPNGYRLSMSATNPIYFTTNGNDPRVAFSGAILPDALIYTDSIEIACNVLVKARALSGTNWSAINEAFFTLPALGTSIHFTEIMYNPLGDEPYEFIELQNNGSMSIDVGGWFFHGIDFTFTTGTILSPGQIVLLANNTDPAAFSNRYPGVAVFGYFATKLDNAGERLALLDASGKIMTAVDYRDSGGWPKVADGEGYSLEINDPFGDPSAPSNWRATDYNGTPGVVSIPLDSTTNPTSPEFQPVRINEIMAENFSAVNNSGFFPDWLELRNFSSNTVNLSGWSLSDDSNMRKFVFPASSSIDPEQYLLVWCDTNTALPGLHTGFNLDRHGETVSLFNSSTTRVDALTFGTQIPDYSLGRIGHEWVLTLSTPGSNNVAAVTDTPANLCLNEWLANAPPGGSDWLELFNRAEFPVPLKGLYLAQSNGIHQIQSLSFIQAHGFQLLYADENPGVDHLNFKLPAAGGVIILYDSMANELDRVYYGAQLQNVSQGRFPDGSAAFTNFVLNPSPGRNNYLPNYTGPVLNEVMALNRTFTNDFGHVADWVELYNPLDTPYDLTAYGLTTAFDNPWQWIFPPGVILPSHGYLTVWFTRTRPASITNELELNVGRAIDRDGDALFLFNRYSLLLDSIQFGSQTPDYSIGRSGPAGGWTLLASPTPGASNAPPASLGSASSLRINEWLASPPLGQDPFFELYNTSTLPVSLSGLYLTDTLSLSGLTRSQIAALSYIGPHGFAKFKADGNLSAGPNHVDFILSGFAGSLRLSSSSLSIIDTVFFGLQLPGVSEGRLPDGDIAITSFPCPTPGDSNGIFQPILITVQPSDQAVLAGSNTAFSVTASGSGTLGYQWLLDNSPVSGANTATLELTAVQPANGGSYSVVVTNGCSAATSSVATLTVLMQPGDTFPSLATQPVSLVRTIGESVQFSVLATSSLPMSYQWSFNGNTLAGQTNSVLSLAHLSITNAGEYRVLVRNSVGSVLSDAALLTVVGPPVLRALRVFNSGDTQLLLYGQLHRDFALDWSSNLHQWVTFTTVTLTNSPKLITVPGTNGASFGFYRAQLAR